MKISAFIDNNDENKLYEVKYFHYPQRWNDNLIDSTNPIWNSLNWSSEIKYIDDTTGEVSDEIKNLPTDKGGVYVFLIKGICLPFLENYIAYIGRSKYTDNQNIRKRAKEYISDTKRSKIIRMFKYWKNHLYYRYYPDTDNNKIVNNEAILINAILPPFNEDLATLTTQQKQPAF
jgi:hypothetical protein